jgi:hypothetical protein
VTSPEVLAAAIARAARDTYRPPPPWMYSSLRPAAPSKPPTITTEIVRSIEDRQPPAAPVAAPAAARASNTRSEVEPVWQALVDVTVWRSRPWRLRVAASLVVRRRNDLRR